MTTIHPLNSVFILNWTSVLIYLFYWSIVIYNVSDIQSDSLFFLCVCIYIYVCVCIYIHTHTYTYIGLFFSDFSIYQIIIRYVIYFPVLYSRSLFILYIVVCICSSQIPNLSLPPLPFNNHKFVFCVCVFTHLNTNSIFSFL